MSWYNNNSTDFIDGTQQFTSTGGSGGNIQVVDGDDVNITDLVELRLDHLANEYEESNPTETLNLYLKNSNTGGEIRFFTDQAVNNNDVSNDALKYVTKIANDGKLYFYYTFNPVISALQLSGWREMGSTLIGVRQGVDNNIGAIAGITGEIGVINSTLNIQSVAIAGLNAGLTTAETTIIDHEARIQVLEAQDQVEDFEYDDTVETDLITGRNTRNNIQEDLSLDILTRAVRFQSLGRVRQIYKLKGLSAYKPIMVFAFNLLGIGGTVVAILALAGRILDEVSKAEELDNLKTTLALKTRITDSTDQAPFVKNKLHLGGLQIDQTTNNSFSTAGDYEVDVIKNGRLNINIAGSPLIATITEILETGDFFTTSDVINVNKNNIGGTTGNLTINITSLKSLNDILDDRIDESIGNLDNIANRQRRRQFIPNKNDFGDGLQVTETNITEDIGDITKDLDISLKVDTSQFNYDATGNLQLTNYSQIATNTTNIATNSGNIATNTADIATNSGNISSIDTRTTNLETYTANLQTQINNNDTDITTNASAISTNASAIANNLFVTNFAISTNTQSINTINQTLTGIQTDITSLETENDDVYKLLLNNNETFSTTTDHIVNIGFNKTEFNNVLFNLIMGAVKLNSPTLNIPFSITDFSGYYFGTYPNMERLNYNEVITLVKQDNSKYYNDINWNNGGLVQIGAYYFTNVSTGVVYDLNKRLEWYGNIRFKTTVSGNNYILRTGFDYEEVEGQPQYQPDNNKLSFYIRDDKFYFSHLCKYDITYYAIRLNQNILIDFLSPISSFVSVTPTYGNSEGYLFLNITTPSTSDQIYFTIDEGFDTVTQTTIQSLINTPANNNPLFCGMVQDYATTNHNPFGMIQLQYPTYTSGNLYKIARLEIEYQIMRHQGTYQNGTWIPNGWTPAIPSTTQDLNNMYEELVFEFFNSYTDTIPAETVLIDTRQLYSTTTNTIIIDFDKSPDLYTYTFEKWRIRPRFNASFSGGYPTLPSGSGYTLYPNQRSAFIHKVKMFPYIQKTVTREKVEEFSDDVTHTIDVFTYNKLNLHFGLNRSQIPYQDIWYKLNDNATKNIITIPNNFITTQLSDLTDLPPNITQLQTDNINFTQPFFVSQGQNAITESNHILIVGDEDTGSEIYITHHGWRFLLPTDADMTETNLNDFDYLIPYNYYHRTAICDRFFSCKEFFADVIDFKRLLIDGNLSYDDMSTSEFQTLSNSSDGIAIKSLASVNIQNLYGLTQNGFVQFDTINGFSTTTSGGGGGTNYWTLVGSTKITYPYTIEVDRVNTNTIVLQYGSPNASITFSDGSSLLTANGLSYYTDADVRSVLQASASATISWDATNNFLVLHQNVLSDISNNGVAITNLQGDLSTANTNISSIQTQQNINTSHINNILNNFTFISFPPRIRLTKPLQFNDGTVQTTAGTHYTDADVRSVLANSGSTNIIWNSTNNNFELNSTITGDIFTLQSDVQQNINNTNNNTSAISLIQHIISQNTQVGTTNTNSVSTLTTDVTTLQTQQTTNTNSIASLQTQASTNTSDITALQTQQVQNSGDIANILNNFVFTPPPQYIRLLRPLQFSDNTIQTTASVNYTDADVRSVLFNSQSTNIVWDSSTNTFELFSGVTGNITANANAILQLQTDLGTANTNITTNANDINSSTYSINFLQSENITNKANIATNTTDIATNTTDIATNTSDISLNTADIGILQTQQLNNSASISQNTLLINTNASAISSLQSVTQSYIFKCNLNLISNINTTSWSYPSIFTSSRQLHNIGGFGYGSQGIIVPISGFYHIIANIRMKNINVDRVSVEAGIAINGVLSTDDERVCGSYVRFASGDDGSKVTSGDFMHYFTANQQVSLAFLKTCRGSVAQLQGDYSTFTMYRIG